MSKSWEEIKPLLDDPYVSADTKEQLLAAYAYENGSPYGEGIDPAAEQYMEKYKPDSPLGYGADPYGRSPYAGYPGASTDEVYEDAKTESEEEGHHANAVSDQVAGNQEEIRNSQAPGSGGSAVKNSDELFDLADPALDVFRNFIPVDKEVPEDTRGVEGPLAFEKDIKKRFDEQRGINFKKFLDEAENLRNAHKTLNGLKDTTDSKLNSLYKDWTGKAANASYDKYNNEISPHSTDLLDYLEQGPKVIESAVESVYKACKEKADQITELYTPTMGSATKETAAKVVKLAKGDFDSQEEVLEVAAWVDSVCGSNLESTIRADDCGLNDENKEVVISECKKWIRESFNADFYGTSGAQGAYLRFQQICDDAVETVDGAWEQLNQFLKEYENQFPKGGEEGTGEKPTDSSETSPPTPPPTGGGPSGGGPSGGGPSGGGPTGGGPTGGGPTGDGSTDTGGNETGKNETGKNPVTGEKLEIDPKTGEPYPIDPETGEAIKDAGDDRDTMTVEQGDNKITMNEPDADGDMGISVDDGSGAPKDYQLDFGGDGETGEQGGGEGEAGAQGGTGQGGEQDGAKQGDQKVYRPGPDGKIHIEDGNLKITAEQPQGPDGPTVVTVDDGTGEPTTYTLGSEEGDSQENLVDGQQGGEDGDTGSGPIEAEQPPVSAEPGLEDGGVTGGPEVVGDQLGGDPAGGEQDPGFHAPGGLDLDDSGGGAPEPAIAEAPEPEAAAEPAIGEATPDSGTPEEPVATTEPSTATGAGAGVGGAGGVGAGAEAMPGGGGDASGSSLNAGSQSGAAAAQPATAGLGSAPGGSGDVAASASASDSGSSGSGAGRGMGGMPMMGGGAGGGGAGGDQERSSQYRIEGAIFDTANSGGHISGSLEDDSDRSIRYDR